MGIAEVKKFVESWLAEAKSLDENAGITQQWSGVPLTEEVIANRKAVARQLMEQANAVLEALGKPCDTIPKVTGRATRDAVRTFTGTLHEYAPDWDSLLFTSQNDWERAEQAVITPYLIRIDVLKSERDGMTEQWMRATSAFDSEKELHRRTFSELGVARDRLAKLESEYKALREAATNAFIQYDGAPLVTMPRGAHDAMDALGKLVKTEAVAKTPWQAHGAGKIGIAMIDDAKLRTAVDYANKLLNRDTSIEWGQRAINADFVNDAMSKSWTWGAAVRSHYDALVQVRDERRKEQVIEH